MAGLVHTVLVRAYPLLARSADEFAESVGVNVHAHTLYEKHHTAVKAKLKELGVRHVRDGSDANSCRYAAEFFSELGIKTTFITGRRVGGKVEYKSPLDPAKIDDELAQIKNTALAAAAAIEGPNEYDLFHDERETDWSGKLRTYQRELYGKVKGDAHLRTLPVVAPSLTSEAAYQAVGSLDEWIDLSCLHLYQSTRHPGTGGWGSNGYGQDFCDAIEACLAQPEASICRMSAR